MTIESELVNLINSTVREIATLSAMSNACRDNVNEKLTYILNTLKNKYDKEDAERLISEIELIKDVLNLNDHTRLKRGISISSEIVNIVFIVLGTLTILSGLIWTIIRIMTMIVAG